MKALVCGSCGDIQAIQKGWRSCKCGTTQARWDNAHAGTAIFKDPGQNKHQHCFVLGLHNGVLSPALQGRLAMFQDFRDAHDHATDAPNYVFDKSRAGCWAVVFAVGRTSDTKYVPADTP